MAIDTYTNLQAALLLRMERPADPLLTERVKDWISLCEVNFHRTLRLRSMGVRATATIDSEYTDLPAQFLEMRNFQLNTSPKRTLELQSPEFIDSLPDGNVPGIPRYFCIISTQEPDGTLHDQIQLAPAPNAPVEAEMAYWRKFTPLSVDNPDNWMLLNAPDVYLWGSLAEGAFDIGDTENGGLWQQKYEMAIARLKTEDARAKWSGASMVKRIPGLITADNRSNVRN